MAPSVEDPKGGRDLVRVATINLPQQTTRNIHDNIDSRYCVEDDP